MKCRKHSWGWCVRAWETLSTATLSDPHTEPWHWLHRHVQSFNWLAHSFHRCVDAPAESAVTHFLSIKQLIAHQCRGKQGECRLSSEFTGTCWFYLTPLHRSRGQREGESCWRTVEWTRPSIRQCLFVCYMGGERLRKDLKFLTCRNVRQYYNITLYMAIPQTCYFKTRGEGNS